jgi:hypothetical protein
MGRWKDATDEFAAQVNARGSKVASVREEFFTIEYAGALHKQGREAEASEILRLFVKAVAGWHDEAERCAAVGYGIGKEGMYRDGVALVRLACARAPKEDTYHAVLGIEYMGAGDRTRAVHQYRLLRRRKGGAARELRRLLGL